MAIVFITGSTDGLGRAAAQSLLDHGHQVVLHARSADRAETIADLASRSVGIVVGVISMTLLSLVSHSFMPMLVCLFVFLAGQQELMAVRMKERQREGTLEVLPVVKPANPLSMGPTAVLDLRPIISVYTWDPDTGAWIRESDPRGRRPF